ncbi:hypothetical protein [Hyphomonas sp.]|uniref:hypothetical protein n=1 Tax=Hyphomonas sp. TaxID=87 RepID=UPI000C937F90|nr:hypothetical protein [Hyphomonas sp.]MAL42890.1 hypothetical protein [Hyphomonas sp.]|tara:strand:+ start:3280 stop:3567 length:288 start_codon:yes stop_codon:yes gene_type:complete
MTTVTITDRRRLEKMLKNRLSEQNFDTEKMMIGNSVEKISDMSDRTIVRRLFACVYESDLDDDNNFVLDRDRAEELLGEEILTGDAEWTRNRESL